MASARDRSISLLARRFRTNLPSSAVVADRPDHPLLFASPDLIVGSEGTLAAFFFPTLREMAVPNGLRARLIAARLALPSHTHCAILYDVWYLPTSDIPFQGFDQIYSVNDAAAAGRLYRSAFNPDRTALMENARRHAMVNYGAIMHVHRMQAALRGAETTNKSRSTGRRPHARSLATFGESYVGDLSDRRRSSALSSMHGYARKTLVENYSLVDGIPVPRRKALDVVIFDEDAKRGLDPGKPVRASAFAGWLHTTSSAAADLGAYMEVSAREFDRTRTRLWSLQDRRVEP